MLLNQIPVKVRSIGQIDQFKKFFVFDRIYTKEKKIHRNNYTKNVILSVQ